MKYFLEVEFEIDDFMDDSGETLEDIRNEVKSVIENHSLTQEPKVKIGERR